MAPYNAIFGATLLLNASVTFRSSSYWKLYKHYFGFSRHIATSTGPDTDSPLLLSSSGHDEATNDAATSETVSFKKAKHAILLKKYLCVYLLAALSDWLQGPYVYALYDAYGYSQHSIAVLFVAGFGSSMIFGSFIGGMADGCGRKKFVIFFTIIYAASCLTKHFKDFWILMVGRLLGGVATSLLFSVFDAWLIRSHADNGVMDYLSDSFSSASYGNSIAAIVAGLVANKAASSTMLMPMFFDEAKENSVTAPSSFTGLYRGGFLNPFDIALLALIACGCIAAYTWDENYGESSSEGSREDDNNKHKAWYDSFRNAFHTTMRNADVLSCGIISSFFEGSMYIFVFMWTPAMKALATNDSTDSEKMVLPLGLIFSTFMVCCMAGSSLFSVLLPHYKVEQLGVGVFATSTLAFLVMLLSNSDTITFLAFNVFEICVGMYFPIMGTMKSVIVPEDKRAAIYNLYRIPLNFIVLFSLLTNLTPSQSFGLCMIMLGCALILSRRLMNRRLTTGKSSDVTKEMEEGNTPVPSELIHDMSSENLEVRGSVKGGKS